MTAIASQPPDDASTPPEPVAQPVAPDAGLTALAALACTLCQTPIALLSRVTPQRQHLLAQVGLEGGLEAGPSLGEPGAALPHLAWTLATLNHPGLLVVPDVAATPPWQDDWLARGPAGIRFYAGLALHGPDGQPLGTLCVMDTRPRELDAATQAQLSALAQVLGPTLAPAPNEALPPGAAETELACYRAIVESQTDLISLATQQGRLTFVNPAFAAHAGHPAEALIGTSLYEHLPAADREAVASQVAAVCAHGLVLGSEVRHPADAGPARWTSWTHHPLRDAHGRVWAVQSVGRDITERKLTERSLKDSQARLRSLYESTPAMLHSIDAQGHLLTVSDTWLAKMGYTRSEVIGRNSADFLTPASHAYARHVVLPRYLRDGRCENIEYQMVRKDGSLIDVLLSATMERDEQGRPLRSLAILEDVTEKHAVERELAEKHELLRVTLHSIGDAVITTDEQGRVQWLNPVAERMTGWRNAEAGGRPLGEVFHVVDETTGEPERCPVDRCLSQQPDSDRLKLTQLISRDGTLYGIEDSAAPIRDAQGQVLGVVLVFHDVTEQRRMGHEMSFRATHDELTGLVNRSEFEGRLQRALTDSLQRGSAHALMYIDLDQFKLVNDACGHAVGDQLLRQVTELLNGCVRARDTLARLGGDEFGVILEHCDVEQAERVAQKICDQMEEFRFVHEGRRFRIGTSIGLVPLDKRWTHPDAIMQAADTSCYAAKEAGRNRVHVWFDTDQSMHTRKGEMQWATRLEQALDEDRFVLYAQRIAPIRPTGEGLRCEVLIRLQEPDGSIIPPGAFLPAAERFQLASRIDRWVVRQVFALLASRHPALDTVHTLAVNLSGQSMADPTFQRYLLELIERQPVDLSKLCFEITETAAITKLAEAGSFVQEMRRLGMRLALDDFGAGSSSFGYLKALQVDYLKIDGQFIKDVVHDPLDRAAVRCFCDVARVMGLKTVGEFVENEPILQELLDLGVDYAQGYLIHRPEPLGQLLGLVPRG